MPDKAHGQLLQRSWGLLRTYLAPQRGHVLLLTVSVLGGIALQLLGPRILGSFIDAAQAGVAVRRLTASGAAFLVVAAAGQAASLATAYLSRNVGLRATNALRRDLALHCLKLDLGFHKRHTPGELIERIDGDVNTLAEFFSDLVLHLLGSGLLAGGILVALFFVDWRVGFAGVAYTGCTVALLSAQQRPNTRAWQAARQSGAELYGFLGERLYGTEDIRANGAEPAVLQGLEQRMASVSRTWLRARVVQSFQLNAGALLFVIAQTATVGLGAWLFLQGRTTIGLVYLVLQYIGLLREPIQRIQRQAEGLQRAGASIIRIEELLNTPRTLADRPGRALPEGPLSITFDAVSFHYDDGLDGGDLETPPTAEADVLQRISFHLPPESVLGLLGRTGSGKTTLTRLLFRLYDPTAGAVRLDGTDVREVALDSLRSRIGLVTQEVQIFHATLRDNLTLFKPGMPDTRLIETLATLGLTSWFASLERGLDTVLQPGGEGLSAGEAQLVALARVFLRNPDIVILDEASARLDPVTERLLDRAVSRLIAGRTAIIIAHRLTTLHRADQVLILEEGSVVEAGPRRQLAEDPTSRFAALLQTGLEEVLA